MNNTIKETKFNLPNQSRFYKGKVRDVYTLNNDQLVMVATDEYKHLIMFYRRYRIKVKYLIKFKKFLDATSDIVPNWKEANPDPSVTIGKMCEPFKVEMVIRGYLTGHAWREYKSGKRMLCGVTMPEGMVENQKFEKPILTPTTKADIGHDEDISRRDIITKNC